MEENKVFFWTASIISASNLAKGGQGAQARIQSSATKKFADSLRNGLRPVDESKYNTFFLRLQWEEVLKSRDLVCVQLDEIKHYTFILRLQWDEVH